MKRRVTAFLAVMLLITLLVPTPVDAQTVWVYTKNGKTLNLRDEYTNEVIGHIPYGTKLETDESKDAQTAAYVTYKGISGYAKWEFLIDHVPPAKKKAAATATPKPSADVQGEAYEPARDDEIEIKAVGAYIQLADPDGKGYGTKYSSVILDGSDDLFVCADIPKGKKIDYWVINGVKYEFNDTVKYFVLKNADQSFTFECVFTKAKSSTRLSAQEIQEARTGERLEVFTVNSQLCHLKKPESGRNGAGGWITYFDFTEDYQNRANGNWEDGGQVTIQVKTDIPKNQRLKGWKFDESEFYFNKPINTFFVRTLNTTITYEPIFSGKKASTKKTSKTVTEAPEPDEPEVTKKPSSKVTATPNSYNTRPKITPTPMIARRITPTPFRRGTGTVTRVTPTPTAAARRVTATPRRGIRPRVTASGRIVTATPTSYGRPSRVTATPASGRRPSTSVTATPASRPSTGGGSRPSSGGTVTRVTATPSSSSSGRRPSASVTATPSSSSGRPSSSGRRSGSGTVSRVTPTPTPAARRRIRFQ